MEEVRAATKGTAWYQVYLVRRPRCRDGHARARKEGGFHRAGRDDRHRRSGMREKDLRNGTKELLAAARRCSPICRRCSRSQAGSLGFLSDGGLMTFPNVMLPDGPMAYADVGRTLEQSMVTLGRSRLDPGRSGKARSW